MNPLPSESHQAWHEEAHVVQFDGWARLPVGDLKNVYESFNEIALFLENKSSLHGRTFAEVGCATGELYRYITRYHREFAYFGFDISELVIRRAKEKYQKGAFFVCGEDLSGIREQCSPDVIFARDVVLHQPNPWAFLVQLIRLPAEAAILRIRTRDKGETVLDPELSCQWQFGNWVPYMVLNMDEVIEKIVESVNVSKLFVYKHYQPLGGQNGRFLPKECYLPQTGTAQTAFYLELASEPVAVPQIVVQERVDPRPRRTLRGLLGDVRRVLRT
jgi:SAM-dependent methyltransferase